MRYLIFIFVFFHFTAFSQFKGEWKPLPKVKGTKAYINKYPSKISSQIPDKKPFELSESYSNEKLEFVSVITPKVLGQLSFTEHELSWSQITDLPNGMVFKDVSTSNIRYLDMAHGLLSNNVTSIVEDSNGLIYIGTDKGIVMYNGSEMHIYEDLPEYSFIGITSLFLDSNERLWIANNVGISYIYKNKLYIPEVKVFGTTHLKGFSENTTTDELIIYTRFNGFFILKGNKFYQYKKNLPNNSVSSAIRSSDGKLWITSAGVGYIERDSLYLLKREGAFNAPVSLYEVNNEIWVGAFVGEFMKFRNDSLFYVDIDNNPKHRIYSMENNDKGLWFTEYGSGVYLIKNNNEVVFVNQNIGLAGVTSYSLMIDDYNNTWVADPFNGVSLIGENIFYKANKAIDLINVNDIEISSNGGTWYFSKGGYLVFENPNGEMNTYTGSGRYCSDGFLYHNDVWLSDAENGLGRLNEDGFTFYNIKEEVGFDSTLYSIQLDDVGNIWGWNLGNKLYRFTEKTFYDYSSVSEWQDYRFVNVVNTLSNIVFALTADDGVIAIKDNKCFNLSTENGLESNQISFVFEDAKGYFWYCMDSKIQLIDTNGQSNVYLSEELQNNPISDILEYDKNTFLATTPNGILSIKRLDNDLNFKLYGKEYGLKVIGNSTIKKDANGNILIGGREDLMVFDPYFLNNDKPAPKLSLNRIMIADSLIYSIDEGIEIEQQIQFSLIFNKIYWGGSSKLFYQLKQGKRDANWNQESSNVISFNELSYGNYQLSVYALGDDKKSEILDIDFVVLPFWYQSEGAIIFYIILAISLTLGVVIYRDRNARLIKRKLENLIDEKTFELQVEKDEVIKQLEQKEILMQEVHHRVKNNLTFLKSLLYLRASASNDTDVKLILDECQARIHSMALVHQNLYDVQDASKVNFNVFLKELFFELDNMFDKEQCDISIDISAKNINIDMRLSVFLGLILNELITNSYKYAFVDRRVGKISVELIEITQGFKLDYSDSGKGLLNGFDIQSSTGFGFKLVNILLSQINATMSYQKKEMNTFTIIIPNAKQI